MIKINQEGFANIALIVLVVVLVSVVSYFAFVKKLPDVIEQATTPTSSVSSETMPWISYTY
ncbi:hypothetical protein LCGC14_2531300, partial [marine sediment metagenome]